MRFSMGGHDVSRLEAFSDAVFAFSATLPVVTLEMPDTFSALVEDLKGFAAFAVSFMALILIWSVHNAFFRRYGLRDRWTVVLNSGLLFVVLYYVFPLKFVVEGIAGFAFGLRPHVQLNGLADLSTLFMLYSTGFMAIFLCVALIYRHAYGKRSELGLTAEEAFDAPAGGHLRRLAIIGARPSRARGVTTCSPETSSRDVGRHGNHPRPSHPAMPKLDDLEARVLRRMLSFCQKRQLIGPHRFHSDGVHVFVGPEPKSFSQHEALHFLHSLLEQENLSEQFLDTFRSGSS